MKKRAESRDDMVITTIALDRELHKRLAIAAVEENAAITEIVRQAVSNWLNQHASRRRKRQ